MNHYGMFVQPGMIATPLGEGHLFGIHAASQGGIRALLDHVESSVRLVCAPSSRIDVERELSGQKNYQLESLTEFLERGPGDTNAWLDVVGDTARPHRFRQRIGGNYPIGVLQHSVSFGYAAHSWFLPLLLGDVRAQDTVICTSSAARESIRKVLDRIAEGLNQAHGTAFRYRGRLDLVPLAVDVHHFQPMPKTQARRQLKIAEGDLVLLWAGRTSALDKADLIPFLRVFRDLAKKYANLRLVLAGAARGEEMQVLGRAASELGVMDRIAALGLVPRAHLPALYSAADVFVSPADSLPETFGLTVVEAMACGLPVVASDWDGYRDTVSHGDTGFLVDTALGDMSLADDLADWSLPQGDLVDVFAAAQATVVRMTGTGERSVEGAIDCLLRYPRLRREMGARARVRAVEKYAYPVVLRAYDDLFDELRAIPTEPSDRSYACEYARTHLGETFSHYATRRIEDSDVVRRTSVTRIQNYRPHLGVVSDETLRRVLDEVGSNAVDIARIESAVGSTARFHIAWLLKQGYLEIVS